MQACPNPIPEIEACAPDNSPVIDAPPDRRSHATLIDQTLPLLGQSWQRQGVMLGQDGKFAPVAGSHCRDRIAINLVHCDIVRGECPALTLTGSARVTLRYDRRQVSAAQAALIACAAQGGWPIARDPETLALLTLSERIAASEIPVLLEGPTGSGKEVFARFVHRMSTRADGPFLAVNCAAMPEAMLEGLLFGHRKGAFTGAGEAREGLFRAADGGTLLLDEIGELPLALQAKLLRTLQEGEVLPLGATKPVKVDVRVVAATNRTLSDEVNEGRFREDLYYRLNVFPLALPALQQRVGDIAPLAFGMLLRHAGEAVGPNWISDSAMIMLERHSWPGNVRELENVIRRALLLAGKDACIDAQHVVFDQPARGIGEPPASPGPVTANSSGSSLSDVAFQSEAHAILKALDTYDGHRGKTARSLGISERTLRYRLASMRQNGLMSDGAEV